MFQVTSIFRLSSQSTNGQRLQGVQQNIRRWGAHSDAKRFGIISQACDKETYKIFVGVEINVHGRHNIILANYYFPLQCEYTNLSFYVNQTFKIIDFSKYRVFITGDFNLRDENWKTRIVHCGNSEVCRKATHLSQLLNYLKIFPQNFLINCKRNLLDLFLTNDNECSFQKLALLLLRWTLGMLHSRQI